MRIDDIDPDEVDGRPRRSRRLLVVGAALVAIAGAVVGVVLWQRGSDDDTTAATDSLPADTAPVPDTVPDVEGKPVIQVVGFPDWGSDYTGPKIETVYQRATESGITITVQDTGNWANFFEGGGGIAVPDVIVDEATTEAVPAAGTAPAGVVAVDANVVAPVPAPMPIPMPTIPGQQPGWVAPGWCNPSGGFRVTMLYKTAVGTSQGQRYAEPRDGISPTLFSSGLAEGTPFRVLVLQVAADITNVGVTFSDGATDSATPANGWVALATPGDPNGKFVLAVTSETGARNVDWTALGQSGDAAWQRGCNPPPPELPPPGDQPDDPSAAEQEIRNTLDVLWDQTMSPDDKPDDLLDDNTGVDAAVEELRNGGLKDIAASAVYTVNDLVFTTPTEAWFEYDITTMSGAFTGRFGVATLIDGKWRIARAVVCQDLSLAGVQCSPPVTQIFPPGTSSGGGTNIIPPDEPLSD